MKHNALADHWRSQSAVTQVGPSGLAVDDLHQLSSLVSDRSDRYRRLMSNGEVHGVGDVAHSMGAFMELPCNVRIPVNDRNDWMKHCRREVPVSVCGLDHLSLGFVLVSHHDYSSDSAEMEVP